MIRVYLFICCVLSLESLAFDFTGKLEGDAEKSKAHFKLIGAQQLSAEALNFKLAINKNAVRLEGAQYPVYSFAIEERECLVFYHQNRPILISPHDEGIEVLNYLEAPVICSKKSTVKVVDYSVKGLEGRWNLQDLGFLDQLQPLFGNGLIKLKKEFKSMNFLEVELHKDAICFYVNDFPLPLSFGMMKFKVEKVNEFEYQILMGDMQAMKPVCRISKKSDAVLELSIEGQAQKFHLAKSNYKVERNAFTKEYIHKKLKAILKTVELMDPPQDEYLIAEKENIKNYVYFLLKDKKAYLNNISQASKKIKDEVELGYFYENAFRTVSDDMNLEESLAFYKQYLKPYKDEISLISSYLILAEKAYEDKKESSLAFIKLAEAERTKQQKVLKDATKEEYLYEYESYLYFIAELQFAYDKLKLTDRPKLEHAVARVFYKNMILDEQRLEGETKKFIAGKKELMSSLSHLTPDEFNMALLDNSFYDPGPKKAGEYYLPWRKLRFYENNPAVDSYNKVTVFMNLASYFYKKFEPAQSYYYLYKALSLSEFENRGEFSWILGLIDDAESLQFAFILSQTSSPDLCYYLMAEYITVLHVHLEDLEIPVKKN